MPNDLYRVFGWIEVIADSPEDAERYAESVIRKDADQTHSLINDWATDNVEMVS